VGYALFLLMLQCIMKGVGDSARARQHGPVLGHGVRVRAALAAGGAHRQEALAPDDA